MKTKKSFFGRRGKTRSADVAPKRNQTSPSRTEEEEESSEKDSDASRKNSMETEPNAPERKDTLRFDSIVEAAASFSSQESGETTASDMMKCLQTLRIQAASITTSTPTPSAASVPRLAPPPMSNRDSSVSNTPHHTDTLTNFQHKSMERRLSRGSQAESEPSTQAEPKAPDWVAFATDDVSKNESENNKARSVSVIAASSGLAETSRHVKTRSLSCLSNVDIKLAENNTGTVTGDAPRNTSQWDAFGEETAFPLQKSAASYEAPSMETVKENHPLQHQALRPPPKPPISRPAIPVQKTGSSERSNDAASRVAEEVAKAPHSRSAWVDSDDDASLPIEAAPEDANPFAIGPLRKRHSSTCSLASKTGDAALLAVLTKYGSPTLELVEIVDASFRGNKLTEYAVRGEVKLKLCGTSSLQTDLSPSAIEALELYQLILRLKCIHNHVFLKRVVAKKSLLDWDNARAATLTRQSSSLTMNEQRKGLVESKLMHWNLGRCYQEALSHPITLLRYPVQLNTLSGPPIKVQIKWQRPRKDQEPVLVDIAVTPNRKLSASLWGVTVCLNGFRESFTRVEASANPEARWNSNDGTFEWSIPIINPDDAVRHLRVKVMEKGDDSISDRHLSASVKFVMPHSTLSGTLLLGWIERKDDGDQLVVEDSKEESEAAGMTEPDLIFCEKMCLSGNYEADTNY